MKTAQIIKGLATALGLVSTGLVSMGDDPSATQWVAVVSSAMAAGLMASLDSSKPMREQFKKENKKQ